MALVTHQVNYDRVSNVKPGMKRLKINIHWVGEVIFKTTADHAHCRCWANKYIDGPPKLLTAAEVISRLHPKLFSVGSWSTLNLRCTSTSVRRQWYEKGHTL